MSTVARAPLWLRIYRALVAVVSAPDVRDRYEVEEPEVTDDDDSEGMAMIQRELDSY